MVMAEFLAFETKQIFTKNSGKTFGSADPLKSSFSVPFFATKTQQNWRECFWTVRSFELRECNIRVCWHLQTQNWGDSEVWVNFVESWQAPRFSPQCFFYSLLGTVLCQTRKWSDQFLAQDPGLCPIYSISTILPFCLGGYYSTRDLLFRGGNLCLANKPSVYWSLGESAKGLRLRAWHSKHKRMKKRLRLNWIKAKVTELKSPENNDWLSVSFMLEFTSRIVTYLASVALGSWHKRLHSRFYFWMRKEISGFTV